MSDGVKAVCVGLAVLVGSHLYQTGSLEFPALPSINARSETGEIGPLGKQVEDDKTRQMLAGLYRELADAVESDAAGTITTTEQFRRGYIASAVLMVQGTEYKKNPDAFEAEVSKRIADAIGLKAVALTPEMKVKLVATLREISKELGG